MSHQTISSELLTELSTKQQEVITGGCYWGRYGYGYSYRPAYGYYGYHRHYGDRYHDWW